MSNSAINSDLVWNLGNHKFTEAAFGFLKRFESAMCLYSGSVHQMYSNYEILHVQQERNTVVALPNAFAAHDTFDNIALESVIPTGLFIVPDEFSQNTISDTGLNMMFRCKRSKSVKTLPLAQGLEKAREQLFPNEDFLPVMINQDLRALKNSIPVMHVHHLHINYLADVSPMVRSNISRTVIEKVGGFYL